MRLIRYALAFLYLLTAVGAEPGWRQGFRTGRVGHDTRGADYLWDGRKVAVWQPHQRCAPLVLFSHGYHGNRNQSSQLCRALAEAGYLVVAVDHRDARLGSGQPEATMLHTDRWTEATYKDRRDDLVTVLHFLRTDPTWAARVDWSLGVALMGHSLGGYTVFGTAGAWPDWRQSECRISAVLGLSPYLPRFRGNGQMGQLGIPAMFQSGSLDLGVKPSLIGGGIFQSTGSPAHYVEFRRAGHFAWTDLNPQFQSCIVHYCLAFLDRYVKGNKNADLTGRLPQVLELRSH
ncbi:MAG: alpha/beta hydrolase [Vulcanimicrobiota bacterium]